MKLLEAQQRLLSALLNRGVKAYTGQNGRTIYGFSSGSDFRLSFMPGNSRTLISHAVTVQADIRNKGVGTKLCQLREEAAKEAGVTLMLCTVRGDNPAQEHLLNKRSWIRLTKNERTNCSLWGKQLW